MSSSLPKPDLKSGNSGYSRLEDQIVWYDQRSIQAQRMFRILKCAQIILVALIPVASLINPSNAVVPGALGAVILIIEGLQELGMYRQNWQKYRSACEALRHEKYLYMSSAGPYLEFSEGDSQRRLAERVEELISQEHTNWISQFQKPKQTNNQ